MLSQRVAVAVGAAVTAIAAGTLWNVTVNRGVDRDCLQRLEAERWTSGTGAEIDRRMAPHKTRLFSGLQQLKDANEDGRLVLVEIGCAGCHNFRYYPPGTQAVCVEPNRHYEPFVREAERKWKNVRVLGFHAVTAEDLSSVVEEHGQADAVVVTNVLCSVDDVDRSLAEIKRVLKPVGYGLPFEANDRSVTPKDRPLTTPSENDKSFAKSTTKNLLEDGTVSG